MGMAATLGTKYAYSPFCSRPKVKQRLLLPAVKVVLTRSLPADQPDSRTTRPHRHTTVVSSVTRAAATQTGLQPPVVTEDGIASPDIQQQDGRHHPDTQRAQEAIPVLSLEKNSVMIWGANTGVGKTLVSAGLSVALLSRRGDDAEGRDGPGSYENQDVDRSVHVEYLKPVQTGYPEDSDARFVHDIATLCTPSRGKPPNDNASDPELDVSNMPSISFSLNNPSMGEHTNSHFTTRSNEQHPALGQSDDTNVRVSLSCSTFWAWEPPVSPHLAAQQNPPASLPHLISSGGDEGHAEALIPAVRDVDIVNACRRFLGPSDTWREGMGGVEKKREGERLEEWVIVETAGGVLSPAPSGNLQADAYRPLRLPALLVGDGQLGGISTTLSSLDALLHRGYDVVAVVVAGDERERYNNHSYLQEHLMGRSIPVLNLPPLPLLPPPPLSHSSDASLVSNASNGSLEQPYSQELIDWFATAEGTFQELATIAADWHHARLSRLRQSAAEARRHLWWPFTQHQLVGEADVAVIDSRDGGRFTVYRPGTEAVNKSVMGRDGGNGSGAAVDRSATRATGTDKHGLRSVERMEGWFDGSASWWTQGPDAVLQAELAREIGAALARYGHVMFPGNSHEPALECAKMLLQTVGKGWAHRVFFSDNGSTAIEVAQRMAFRAFCCRHGIHNPEDDSSSTTVYDLKVIALVGSYHGDTLGALHTQSPSAFTSRSQHPWYGGKSIFLDPPTVGCKDGQWHVVIPPSWDPPSCATASAGTDSVNLVKSFSTRDDVFGRERDTSALSRVYMDHISAQLQPFLLPAGRDMNDEDASACRAVAAALMIEPVLQGAGGMLLIDPLFQRCLVHFCRSHSIPVVFDEVFTGCWRLGAQSAADLLGCMPDIACYAKLLTAGVIPLAVTLATSDVFQAFEGPSKLQALLHGHSYTAHPAGCTAACVSLRRFWDPSFNHNLCHETNKLQELWDPRLVDVFSRLPAVQRVVSLGTVFALELTDSATGGYNSTVTASLVSRLRHSGISVRPLGNILYLMCSPLTRVEECEHLLSSLHQAMEDVGLMHG